MRRIASRIPGKCLRVQNVTSTKRKDLMMKRLLFRLIVLAGLCLTEAFAAAGEKFVITENGQAQCVIAVAARPGPAERTAALELQAFLLQITGAELPIRPCSEVAGDARQIVVGPSERSAELLPDVNLHEIGDDGIVIRTVGNALVLAGPPPRGTLYAVYTFLEDQVGCRWWTPTESTIPRKESLGVPALAIRYAPKLKSREAYYRDAFEAKFSARQKLNGHGAQTDEDWGGNIRFQGFVHTFYPFLPPETYFKDHPDWYSLIDGKRSHDRAQLCLTSEPMRAEMTRVVLQRLAGDPGAKIVSISQNDWLGACQCGNCRAVVAEEGSEAGPLLRFVNAVAAEVEKKYPDVWVETLAYQYTRQAPLKARPRDNVIVRLCSIECSFVQTLGEGKQNEAFRNDIEAWSRIAPRLFVWNYVTNFSNYLVPHPNLRVLAPNLRYFVNHNVVGLFEQGDSQSGVGDFVRLRAWLLAHLMWNPAADENALIDEFLQGYYGPAAPYLRAYLNVINDAGERSGKYIKCFMPDTAAWLTLDDLNRGSALFAKAEAAVAGDKILAGRVRRERLPLDHVWLTRYRALKLAAQLGGKQFLGPDDPAAATKDFIRVARENGVGNWRENRPFAERAEVLLRKNGPPATPPEEAKGLAPADWLDFQDGEFHLAQPGEWAGWADDPAASDGRAARMPGDHFEWAVSLPFSDDLEKGNPWHVYVVARCDATATTGPAMTTGIYDAARKTPVAQQTIPIEGAAGSEYRTFDLGAHELSGSMYFWLAPPKRPGDVQHVYIDRVFLIRQPK